MRKAILDVTDELFRKIVDLLPAGVTGPPDALDFDNPPQGVCAVEVHVKLYGEGLPDKFETPEGHRIKYITIEELQDAINTNGN